MTRSCSHQHGHVKYAEFHRWHIWKYVSTYIRVREAEVGQRCASTERWMQIFNREELQLLRETSRRVFWQQVSQIAANRSEWQKIVSGRCWDNITVLYNLSWIWNWILLYIQIFMVGGIEIAALVYWNGESIVQTWKSRKLWLKWLGEVVYFRIRSRTTYFCYCVILLWYQTIETLRTIGLR